MDQRTASGTRSVQDRSIKYLASNKKITEEQLRTAQEAQKQDRQGRSLVYHLRDLKIVDGATMATALEKTFGVPSIDLTKTNPDPQLTALIKGTVARDLHIAPIEIDGNSLVIAIADPFDLETINKVRQLTKLDPQPKVADDYSLHNYIEALYKNATSLHDSVTRATSDLQKGQAENASTTRTSDRIIREAVEKAGVPRMLDSFMADAVRREASDIHFEFFDTYGQIRYRIDGSLVAVAEKIDRKIGPLLLNRIKVVSDLNSTQDKIPQDGRTALEIDGKTVDFRVSTLPTASGVEKAVLRILGREDGDLDLDTLGIEGRDYEHLLNAISKTHGMVLVTGPTGSGKSTTLYSALKHLNQPHRNVVTVEDPVERKIEGITQVNVKPSDDPRIDLSYGAALRAFLRQDPNVIMVGEIRDPDTAQIAIRAAMTGHLVLSTVHTNDTASTISRLIDIGVEQFNIVAGLALVIAQRLVRRICPRCKVEYTPSADELAGADLTPDRARAMTFYRGEGCEHCSGTGYKGRVGLYEVMPISTRIKGAITSGKSVAEIRNMALSEQMTTLRTAGFKKVRAGITTLQEVISETAT
jgi:type IV pilus assembly protein PilB